MPQVRAAIADIFRGAITIFVRLNPRLRLRPSPPPLTDSILYPCRPSPWLMPRPRCTMPLRLPTHPPGLGLPDDVYLFLATTGRTLVFSGAIRPSRSCGPHALPDRSG
ncbi:MAG: hypothetical protein H6661_07000 [Ardenticatenaceae bacterium]|nr:hypothetical protein [Ardenticatenaceae bacterium]